MGSIKDWFVRRFLLGWLKEKFDALPFDGKKTALGVVLLVLGILLKAFPEYALYITAVLEILNQLPFDAILTDTGVGAVIVGALHKALKYFGKDLAAPATPKIIDITRH